MRNVVFLHGAIGSSAQLNPIIKELSGTFHAYSFNFSGHGGEPFSGDFSIEKFATELNEFINEKSIAGCDIFGYSMGGFVALYHAAHYPDRTGKIFTLATKFNWDPEIAKRETGMLNPEKIEEKIPAFAEILRDRHAPNSWKEVLVKTSDMMLSLGNSALLTPELLKNISNIVRVTVGDKDQMVTLEETIAVHRNLKTSSLQVLPDTIHPIEKMDVKLVASAFKSFILS
jgi:pimeloyl-ACP methyl ester carboxylesterase